MYFQILQGTLWYDFLLSMLLDNCICQQLAYQLHKYTYIISIKLVGHPLGRAMNAYNQKIVTTQKSMINNFALIPT